MGIGITVADKVREIVTDYTKNHRCDDVDYEICDGYKIKINVSGEISYDYSVELLYKGEVVDYYDTDLEDLDDCVMYLMDEIDFG